jgi:translation initiation factor 3 subunit F
VAVDVEYQSNMRNLFAAVNPNEVVVGWYVFATLVESPDLLTYAIIGRYATGPEVTEHSMVIHDIVNDETRSPVHLCVDTSLANNRMAIKAMIRSVLVMHDS